MQVVNDCALLVINHSTNDWGQAIANSRIFTPIFHDSLAACCNVTLVNLPILADKAVSVPLREVESWAHFSPPGKVAGD
jgi:hypothetical protein